MKAALGFAVLSSAILAVAIGAHALRNSIDDMSRADLSLRDVAGGRPIFSSRFSTATVRLYKSRQRKNERGEAGKTLATADIIWQPTIEDAIQKATAEDKPIFLVTYVRQRTDPECDV